MTTINELSSEQLRKAATIKEQIAQLETELQSLLNDGNVSAAKPSKGGMSSAARAKISAAVKARWAKAKAPNSSSAKPAATGKKQMSAAAKAKISAAAKARWAKIKAAK